MAVIPLSQVNLSRARRNLNRALKQRDWEALRSLDKDLGDALTSAAVDPQHDKTVLLGELGQILKLYREMVEACQAQASELVSL